MAQSIKQRTAAVSNNKNAKEIRLLLEAALADITALDTAIDTLIAKLNADVGVTDENYAGAAAMTLEA